MIASKKLLYIIFSTLLATGVCIAVVTFIKKTQASEPVMQIATLVKSPTPLKQFNLLATNGHEFTQNSLLGQWSLIFFGYTKCPDICPKTLNIVRNTWGMLNNTKQRPNVQFIFTDISNNPVSIDELKEFLHNYNPEFIGLSGSTEAVHSFSDQLGIYTKSDEDKIDHTAALMLIDPQGRLQAIFTPPFSAQDIVHDLTLLAL